MTHDVRKLAVAVVALWICFCGAGLAIHHVAQTAERGSLGFVEIGGYDSEGLLTWYVNVGSLFNVNHRHPLQFVVLSPVVALGSSVAEKAGAEAGYRAVICAFAAFGALNFLLLWMVMAKTGVGPGARLAAAALWLSFAQTWILGGLVESFPVSMSILLRTLLLAQRRVRDWRVWTAAALLAGAVTITNGVKPLLAWFACGEGTAQVRRMRPRVRLALAGGAAGLVALGAAALALKWKFVDGYGIAQGASYVWADVSPFFAHGMSLSQRLGLVWNSFWCEPLILHGGVIGHSVVAAPYRTVFPHLVCGGVLALCLWSAVRNFRLPLVRAMLAMVSVDFFLHVLLGWGLEEGQIYCGHWMWIVPILIALLPSRAAVAAAALAVAAAALNALALL